MSRWKKANWDKWTLGKKIRHVIAVIASLISILIMFFAVAYIILIIFGIQGFIMHIKDMIVKILVNLIFY